jgi:CxxC motif-containing protein (DUF1111 family)
MISRIWVPALLSAFILAAVLAGAVAGKVAQPSSPTAGPAQTPTPAPAAFDNKTNGFTPQEVFDKDKDAFDETEEVFPKPEVEGGLGPVYNATSCVGCHQNAGFVVKREGAPGPGDFTNKNPADSDPGIFFSGNDAVSGTSSQVSEIRAGHNETVNGKLLFREAKGGSVIQQRAIDPKVQEHVPNTENIRTLRMATSILGDGLVEMIPDLELIRVRDQQKPDVRGVANIVQVVVDVAAQDADGNPTDFIFEPRIGRFGWKSQEASLLNFSAGAYVTEMGITSPLQQNENTSLCMSVADFDPVEDPEDEADLAATPPVKFGEDVEAFARFMRSTKAPPQAAEAEPPNVANGRRIFNEIGCAECHHTQFQTAPRGTRFGDFTVPAELALRTFKPYSDFLLHDIGTGDGIVQTQYAELPPTGLTRPIPAQVISLPDSLERGLKFEIDFKRLNELLKGHPDPKYPRAAETNQLRTLTNLGPSIQVIDPSEVTSLRLRADCQPVLFTRKTANLIRTAPLWGLRTRPQLLHDGLALTLRDAIKKHRIQAARARRAFDGLTPARQRLVLDFLNFL